MKDFLSDEEEIQELISLADAVRERAYVPYSGFRVGACIVSESGVRYIGCNIENASYTPTNCAERTALFKAVADGERRFTALAVISDSDNYTYPCGVCRQALAEFCESDMPVICARNNGEYRLLTLGELLPMAFRAEDMR